MLSSCTSKPFRIGTRPPRSCCARATAKAACKRTLCNRSDWPTAHIEGLRGVLKGGTVIPAERDAFTVIRSLPHGHVAVALGIARKIGLDRIIGASGDRCRDLVLALLVSRILDPASKLAAAHALSPATAASSLGELLGLGEVDEDELYAALDWLPQRQPAIYSDRVFPGSIRLTSVNQAHLVLGTIRHFCQSRDAELSRPHSFAWDAIYFSKDVAVAV